MKNLKFSRLFAAALLVACFAFAGCKPQVEEVNVSLLGTWVGSYPGEEYTITTSTFKSAGSYEGNNLCVVMTSDTSGYIFIKYTKAGKPDWSGYSTDPAEAPDVGKWYAISYKDLTSSSIQIAGAYKDTGATSKDTLEEAISEFTIENEYFEFYSTCIKE